MVKSECVKGTRETMRSSKCHVPMPGWAWRAGAVVTVSVALLLTTVPAPAEDFTPEERVRVQAAIDTFSHMAVTGRSDETHEERDARMAWWREARLGMFIHWGIYSMLGGEYKGRPVKGLAEWALQNRKIPLAEYRRVARDFNPVKYDPEAWVRLAKESGMKYIVITTKHHDGFALYDSDVSDWNVVKATEYGKDLVAPLAEACARHGIRLGFYYSQAQDWYHPGGGLGAAKTMRYRPWDPEQEGQYDDYLQHIAAPQVRELLTRYGPVASLWWDTPYRMLEERAAYFDFVTDLQPGIIENNRRALGPSGDFGTSEGRVGRAGSIDWETCMTMDGTWGYRKSGSKWKTPEAMLRSVIDGVSRGGNYLMNVGPTPKGEFPPKAIEILQFVGRWMKVNGDAIYGTERSPFDKVKWGRFTRKGNTVYAIVYEWPADGLLRVRTDGASAFSRAYLLADPDRKPIDLKADGEFVFLSGLPTAALDPVATVIVMEAEPAEQ